MTPRMATALHEARTTLAAIDAGITGLPDVEQDRLRAVLPGRIAMLGTAQPRPWSMANVLGERNDDFGTIERFWRDGAFRAALKQQRASEQAEMNALLDAHRDRALMRRDLNEALEIITLETLA